MTGIAQRPASDDARSARPLPLPARLLRTGFVVLLYWMVASAVLETFMTNSGFGPRGGSRAEFGRVIRHEVPRPYVYRVLAPWTVNAITAVLPAPAAKSLRQGSNAIERRLGLPGSEPVELMVAYYLMFACFLGAMFAWRAALRHFPLGGAPFRDLFPAAAMIFLPDTFMYGGFLYDPLELLLTSWAFVFFLRRSWPPFYAVLALATINKEASATIAVWFLARFALDRDRAGLLRHAALSLAVVLPTTLWVRWIFRDRVGTPFEFHLPENLEFLARAGSYFDFHWPYAPLIPVPQGPHLFNLALLLCALLLVWRSRRLRESRLAFLLTIAALAPLWLAFGWRDEIRVFAPAFAPLVVLGAAALLESFGEPVSRDVKLRSGELSVAPLAGS